MEQVFLHISDLYYTAFEIFVQVNRYCFSFSYTRSTFQVEQPRHLTQGEIRIASRENPPETGVVDSN